jgi:predicted ATPase/DNA-binding winged helix-turn-helix (wHTH) protein
VAQQFEIVRAARRVTLNGLQIHVIGRAYDVMLVLYERRERVVTKNELLDLVWPELVVEEGNIQVQVSALRKALGRQVITTVPGRGYQWTLRNAAEDGQRSGATGALDASINAQPQPLLMCETNVPKVIEPLVGRNDDVRTLESTLANQRWVVLLGTGGIGKTRLAQVVAHRMASIGRDGVQSFANGVWWIDLSDMSAALSVAEVVARGMNIAAGSGEVAETNLLQALASRRVLLVIDNCEQWVLAVSAFVAKLLAHAPGVSVMCTTQESFDHPLARIFRVAALKVAADTASVESMRQCDAVQLLVKRATAVERRFFLSDDELADALALCRALDGIPLALEMAAVQLPQHGAKKLRTQLVDRIAQFQLTHHDLPTRQRTLLGTLEWSYGLLSGTERDFLNALAVYQNGFPLDAIAGEQVTTDEPDAELMLSALIDKSLVQVEPGDRLRYRLLETTRLHAHMLLHRSGALDRATYAHLQAMKRVAACANADWQIMSEEVWIEAYWPDYLNLDAAFEAANALGDAVAVAAIGGVLFELEEVRGVLSPNVRERTRIAYAWAQHTSAITRAALLSVAANGIHIPDPVAPRLDVAKERLQAWRDVGDVQQAYKSLARCATEYAIAGDVASAQSVIDELTNIDSSGFPVRVRMFALRMHGLVIAYGSDVVAGVAHNQKLLKLTELWGAKRRTAITRMQLADALFLAGDVRAAISTGEQAVAELEAAGQMTVVQYALTNLCSALAHEGRIERARQAARKALSLASSANLHAQHSDAFALVAVVSGQLESAARLVGVGDTSYRSIAVARQPVEARIVADVVQRVAASLGQVRCDALREDGQRLSSEDSYALASETLNPIHDPAAVAFIASKNKH